MSQTITYTLSDTAEALTTALFKLRRLFPADRTPPSDRSCTPPPEPSAAQPAESTHQELWITLRFKGYADALADPRHIANDLLAELQAHLELKYGAISFAISQPGDVMEIEEEAEIYDTVDPETLTAQENTHG